jgi:hypothetical protein
MKLILILVFSTFITLAKKTKTMDSVRWEDPSGLYMI